jgi:hypothetical protein
MLRILLLVALASPCLAAAPPGDLAPSRDQLREAIDARGRVTDPELRRRTGWEVIRGFTWRIELQKDPWQPGKLTPVDAKQPFHNGDRFRLQIEAFCDVYVYVVVRNADGQKALLFPDPGLSEQTPRLAKGQKLVLPPDGPPFKFAGPHGKHQLRLIASPVKLPCTDPEKLLALDNGQPVPTEREPAPEAPRSVEQVKGLRSAVRQIDEGTLAKGCMIELIEPAPEANLVTLTTSDPSATPILVHDVELAQVD